MASPSRCSGTLFVRSPDGAPALDLSLLQGLGSTPPLFAPGKLPFWDDPHISAQMLAAHLDPDNDTASRKTKTIDRSVAWMVSSLGLRAGTRVLDLGCGPGLYASRLAGRGMRVTGVDYSRRSIAYAREQASIAGLDVQYCCQDYLTLDFRGEFDVALLIYYDLGALPDAARDRLLDLIRDALRPGGLFVFDVLTAAGRRAARPRAGWAARGSGFWRPGPHLVLTRVIEYPDTPVELDEYMIVEPDGGFSVYRLWTRHYCPNGLSRLLESHGFAVERLHADLTGGPLTAGSLSLAAIARRL